MRAHSRCFGLHAITGLVGGMAAFSGVLARGEFAHVINSPPDVIGDYETIGSNTQVNLYPGATTPRTLQLGPTWTSADNIEFNLLGGTFGSEDYPFGGLSTSGPWARNTNVAVNIVSGKLWGDLEANGQALVTMSGGTITGRLSAAEGTLAAVAGGEILGGLSASQGSLVQLSGGEVGRGYYYWNEGVFITGGSVLTMTGGVIGGSLSVQNSFATISGGRVEQEIQLRSGTAAISGGSLGRFVVDTNASLMLAGNEFQVDGAPVGPDADRSDAVVALPQGSVLTGVLADGTPLILSNNGSFGDYLESGRATVAFTPVPPAAPGTIDPAHAAIPAGLRAGQALVLHEGTAAPRNFTALPGSRLEINGGDVGARLETAGADVDMSAGSIAELALFYRGTNFRMTGGSLGDNAEAFAGSHLEIAGGRVGHVFELQAGSEVRYSGGTIGSWMLAQEGSSLTIAGGEFRIDGVPVAGLGASAAPVPLDVPSFSVLSGTLADGTPFAINNSGSGWLAPGTLALESTTVPAAGPAIVRVPNDPAPAGLRSGQTLLLSEGGEIGERFTAGWGSVVRMTGGTIGPEFKAVGSLVNIAGGEVGSVQAMAGSVVNFSGGAIEYGATAYRGAVLNISGSATAGYIEARDGGRVNIAGGHIDLGEGSSAHLSAVNGGGIAISQGVVRGEAYLSENGSLSVSGGELSGPIHAWTGSRVELSGGRVGNVSVDTGGRLTISGSDMRVNGLPIQVQQNLVSGLSELDLALDDVLSGVLSDGTPFAIAGKDGDWLAAGTVQLRTGLRVGIPLAPITIPLFPGQSPPEPQGVLPGETLVLAAGQSLPLNASAGWGSSLTVAGGDVGDNFEAVGAQVTISGGTVGAGMDAFTGSVVHVTGGHVGAGFEAHRGSIVNITGGVVEEVIARAGSVVDISGGAIARYFEELSYSGRISLESGSELHISGSDFLWNGNPVVGLTPGSESPLPIDDPRYLDGWLSGRLADGSPFAVLLSNFPPNDASDWQFDAALPLPTVTLTATLPGDFDGNGLVDAADLAPWQQEYGNETPGLPTRNGGDLLSWQRRLAPGGFAPVNTAVPEPAAWLLAALSLLVGKARRYAVKRRGFEPARSPVRSVSARRHGLSAHPFSCA